MSLTRQGLLLLSAWTFISALYTRLSLATTTGVCNGHGRLHPLTGGSCNCEWPYTGQSCDVCADGFYGDPRDGAACILGCSGDRILANFTFAGIGVSDAWIRDHAPLIQNQTFCLWYISPGSPSPPVSTDSALHTAPPQGPYWDNFNSSASAFNISLQLHSNYRDNGSICNSDTLLIYNRLPNFISSLISQYQSVDSIPNTENLLAVYTGMELETARLDVHSSLLTVVYFHSGVSASGFNATVTVGEELGVELQEAIECSCIIMEDCDCARGPSISVLIPSLTSALLGLATPSNHTPFCSGRIHHSAVYSTHSNSVYVFGGVDITGVMCPRGMVRIYPPQGSGSGSGMWEEPGVWSEGSLVGVVGGIGMGPSPRYQHTATLTSCAADEANDSTSCVLVLGGFTSRGVVSDELWMFDIFSEQWTQLTSAPFAVASHTATLVDGGVVIVIGGVTHDFSFRASVMAYHIQQDSWEVWSTGSPALSSVYGHTATYLSEEESVLVYGGVSHDGHAPTISTTPHSLHLPMRVWSVAGIQVEPVVFHSAVLIADHQLLISGGLTPSDMSGSGFGERVCPADVLTIVNLNSSNPTVATLEVSTPLLGGWGHTSVADAHTQDILFIGGANESPVTILRRVVGNLCALAQDHTHCHALFQCEPCVNVSDHSLLTCYDTSNVTIDNIGERCSLIGGEIQVYPSVTSSIEECEGLGSCRDCFVRDLGCLWCDCIDGKMCVNSTQCPCNLSAPARFGACPSDACGYSSCVDCLNDTECMWAESMGVAMCSSIAELAHYGYTQSTCPAPCGTWTSCSDCISAHSPNEGRGTCLWSDYAGLCMSDDIQPLLCSDGKCGPVVSSCPISCSDRQSCDQCLLSPECAWMQERGSLGACASIAETPPSPDVGVHYLECPTCGTCSGHGRCLDTLLCDCHHGYVGEACQVTCECNGHGECQEMAPDQCTCHHGYVGEACQVTCECNGHGKCQQMSPDQCTCHHGYVGEACQVKCECNGHGECQQTSPDQCFNCANNTRGSSCQECQPFFVGSGINGGQCVPCEVFCHGNSQICMSESDRQIIGDFTDMSRLNELLTSGPTEEEGVCLECRSGSNGTRCEGCRHGYYDSAAGGDGGRVVCTECGCNEHSDGCDLTTGRCSCQNNTVTLTLDINNQCSLCDIGYVGDPTNGYGCYQRQIPNRLLNLTLPSRDTTLIAVERDNRGNVLSSEDDITLTFVVLSGQVDVYVSIKKQAIKVVGGQVVISEGYEVLARSPRNTGGVEAEVMPPGEERRGDDTTPTVGGIRKREFQSEFLGMLSQTKSVYRYQVSTRLTLVLPYDKPDFNSLHYIAIHSSTQRESSLLFEYNQDTPKLNLYVFFTMFFTSVTLASSLLVLSWKTLYECVEWRERVLERQLNEERAARPLYSAVVYLHNGKTDVPNQIDPLGSPDSGEVVGGAMGGASSDDLDYEAVDSQLKSKSLVIVDGDPVYLTRRKSPAEKARSKSAGDLVSTSRQNPSGTAPKKPAATRLKKRKPVVLDPSELEVWPIARQPTFDEKASVHSLIIQMPGSRTIRHAVCVGSTLATFTNDKKSPDVGSRRLAQFASRFRTPRGGNRTPQGEVELQEIRINPGSETTAGSSDTEVIVEVGPSTAEDIITEL